MLTRQHGAIFLCLGLFEQEYGEQGWTCKKVNEEDEAGKTSKRIPTMVIVLRFGVVSRTIVRVNATVSNSVLKFPLKLKNIASSILSCG